MLINGAALNTVALNTLGGGQGSAMEPVAVPQSVLWSCRVMLGTEDVTAKVAGKVRVEREEGAAAIAEFSLYLPDDGVDVVGWTGRSVEIFYLESRESGWIEEERFDGWLEQPSYDPRNRIVSCAATDRLQDLVEAMEIDAIDTVVGGTWTADVFEATEGRSRWDYATERLASVAGSLDRSVGGVLRVTPWKAQAPLKRFGPGSTIDGSLSVDLAKLSDRINQVEITFSYRFSRLRERHQAYNWQHPDIQGWSVDNSFCIWRGNSTELPTIEMVEEALNSAGYKLLSGAEFLTVPLSGVYCDPPQAWNNQFNNLLLAANVVGGMRWVQPITEKYVLTVEAPTSVAQAGPVLRRDGEALESELKRSEDWESAEFTDPEPDAVQDAIEDYLVDLREEDRLATAASCLLEGARVSILGAHRGNKVAWQVPTTMALGIDLVHTVLMEDRIQAQGKVFSLIDEFDLQGQTAISTITLAISRGGGTIDDPTTLPAPPASDVTGTIPALIQLPTQLRGRGQMTYDDTLDGFSGNYDELDIGTPTEEFPRRHQTTAPEVPAEHRDEFTAETAKTYRVAIPNDLLRL
ncbi:hypothetical protein IB274_02360 [Pseudomonas sp. PDM18]|uniref:hypothetical protein n=1 Tax=Pseudomonas sp. PDM18 TaxID=2769253 RepID=UPI001785D1AC|nr:hypothetical protein [Pseudomonas sp. PDM18]MBD9675521.1 hypothetical protein [Pseudomonas sp. PDM18]